MHLPGLNPGTQSKIILGAGAVLTLLIFCGLTDCFRGVEIPEAYRELGPLWLSGQTNATE